MGSRENSIEIGRQIKKEKNSRKNKERHIQREEDEKRNIYREREIKRVRNILYESRKQINRFKLVHFCLN